MSMVRTPDPGTVTDAPIAVVDGYSTGKALTARLHAAGKRLIHVRSSPDMPDYFLNGFRSDHYDHDLGHVDSVDLLVRTLRAHGVRHALPGTESGVILADRLCHALGFPGNDVGTLRARRNKAVMADRVRQAGLSAPFGRTFDTTEAATAWAESAGLREVVVKPVDSAGTDNVWFCNGPQEVEYACKRVLSGHNLYGRPNRSVLVQERLHGAEYYVNTVTHGGLHRVAEMWRYTKSTGSNGAPIYDFEEPVPAGWPAAGKLRTFVFTVLDALGVRSAAAHTEVMLTERGPALIETGARLGGATLPDVVERFCGVSQTGLYATALTDRRRFAEFDERQVTWAAHVRNVSLTSYTAGVVRSDRWRARLESLPTFVSLASPVGRGDWLEATSNLLNSPGFVYLAAADPAAVGSDYRTIRAWERAGLYLD